MRKNVFYTVFLFLLISFNLSAQINLTPTSKGKYIFPLVSPSTVSAICYDAKDEGVVGKSAQLLSEDIRLVTGKSPDVLSDIPSKANNLVIVGTIGKSAVIDKLVNDKKINVTSIVGGWEQYMIEIVNNPLPGVKKALVVAGSDRRGTAYGVFSISEAIGVSPWYWWADAPVKAQKNIYLQVNSIISSEPSVKYRGIFINDEDWGLLRWARDTFETDRKNIGPKTYAKVCELILRLKGNYLCPAMHGVSTAFNAIPENKIVADSYGIVMGSVHCEPLLFNNASEWDKKTMGEWNYTTNKEGINKVLKNRVQGNAAYENVYTLALRGLHDAAMVGSSDMKERVRQLEKALNDQRQILTDVIGKPQNEIPQAFTPYKEVLDVYTAGLNLPDDVTIIWPDDNYGYMKRLSSPREQKRSGRSGVYYHVSYLGKPHDYLWMSTTPPSLMYEELRKAYDTTADRVWLLNVGDIKSCEFSMDLFLAMAYNIDAFNYDNVATYHAKWLSDMFGEEYFDKFVDITQSFYQLAFSRKPEFMGWGYQWATNRHGNERNTDTDFSFSNYSEAERRLAEYRRIGAMTEEIMKNMPENHKAGFYQTLYYPVKGCELLNLMVLTGQKNRWYATQGRASANMLKDDIKIYFDSLQTITKGYNSLLDGKWNNIMTMNQGFASSYFKMPAMSEVVLENKASMGIWLDGQDLIRGGSAFNWLPTFSTYYRKSSFFDIFSKGAKAVDWSAKASEDWILLDKKNGTTNTQDRVLVAIDWNNVPVGEKIQGSVEVLSNGQKEQIFVSVFNPSSPSRAEMDTLFVEHNGYISIDAARFHRKLENDDIKIELIPNMGFEGISVQLGNPIAPMQKTGSSIAPRVEYDFYTFQQGSVDVYTYVLPTFTLSNDLDYAGHEATNIETRYGVSIDDGPVMNPSTSSFEYAQIWYESALKNCRINKTTLHINKPGKHTLNIICGDAGTVVQKVVLDFGGMKRSYLGPQPTRVN